MLVAVVIAWVVVAYISDAVSTLTVYVIVGVETDSMRAREDTLYICSTIFVYTVLSVIQEPPKISTTTINCASRLIPYGLALRGL